MKKNRGWTKLKKSIQGVQNFLERILLILFQATVTIMAYLTVETILFVIEPNRVWHNITLFQLA